MKDNAQSIERLHQVRGTAGRWSGSPAAGLAAIACVLAIAGLGYAAAAGLFHGGLTPQRIVDRQQGDVPHAGFRRAHAKGVCIVGRFRSSGALASWSRADLFRAGAVTPFVGRFSIGGNNPAAPDLKARVRSLALDFRLANGERWRTAMNTPPVLAVRDPQGFFDQIAATAPDPATGKPDPDRVAAFVAAHPEGAAFRDWQATYRPSASFATERYHSINAFWLEDSAGRRQAVRWQAEPLASPEPPSQSGPNVLVEEISQRVSQGPVHFALVFVLASPDDLVDDPSLPWPIDRPRVMAGTIEITASMPQRDGACNGINFDPLVLPAGIRPSDDPILHARSAAYAVSLRRRATEAMLGGGR